MGVGNATRLLIDVEMAPNYSERLFWRVRDPDPEVIPKMPREIDMHECQKSR